MFEFGRWQIKPPFPAAGLAGLAPPIKAELGNNAISLFVTDCYGDINK